MMLRAAFMGSLLGLAGISCLAQEGGVPTQEAVRALSAKYHRAIVGAKAEYASFHAQFPLAAANSAPLIGQTIRTRNEGTWRLTAGGTPDTVKACYVVYAPTELETSALVVAAAKAGAFIGDSNCAPISEFGAGDSFSVYFTMDRGHVLVAPAQSGSPSVTGLNIVQVAQAPGSQVVLVNSGLEPVAVSGLTLTPGFNVVDGCGGMIPAEGWCSLGLTFSPAQAGRAVAAYGRIGRLSLVLGAGGRVVLPLKTAGASGAATVTLLLN